MEVIGIADEVIVFVIVDDALAPKSTQLFINMLDLGLIDCLDHIIQFQSYFKRHVIICWA